MPDHALDIGVATTHYLYVRTSYYVVPMDVAGCNTSLTTFDFLHKLKVVHIIII